MTPFMVHLPTVDKNIIEAYPEMGEGRNSGLLYITSSATMEQNATYVHNGRKEIISSCANFIQWHLPKSRHMTLH